MERAPTLSCEYNYQLDSTSIYKPVSKKILQIALKYIINHLFLFVYYEISHFMCQMNKLYSLIIQKCAYQLKWDAGIISLW